MFNKKFSNERLNILIKNFKNISNKGLNIFNERLNIFNKD